MKLRIQIIILLLAAVAFAVGLPLLLGGVAPYQITHSECLVCGRMRTIEKRWMRSEVESIDESEGSRWMDERLDSHTKHWWYGCSTETRGSWFGSASIGCGGLGGVSNLKYLTQRVGPEEAEAYVQNYLQLAQAGDRVALTEFITSKVHARLAEISRQ